MQHDWKHVERPGGSHTALDGKKIKDAAVYRLAKSITQLTLCQVTTSEVEDATKLLEKARQKLQGIQNIPSQRSMTLMRPYANSARLAVYWIVVQYLPVTK